MQSWPGLLDYARTVELPRTGLHLFLYEAGDVRKPAIVLVHGLGDEADTWRYLLPELSTNYHVIAPDLPGFGRSDQPQRSYSMQFYEEALAELYQALDIERASLVGHSLGAMIVQSFALNHPEKVERLVLVSGSLAARRQKLDLPTLVFLIPGLGEWTYNRLRRDPQAAFNTLAPYYHDLAAISSADQAFLFQRVNQRVWSDGQRRAFLSTIRNLARWLPAQQRGLPEALGKLRLPTEVIWGKDDQINNVENGRWLAEIQPTARLTEIPSAGHNLHQEKPISVLEMFLDKR